MFRVLCSLMLVLVMSAAAFACPCSGDDSPCKCEPGCQCFDTLGGVKFTEERVLVLPQDQGKYYLTLFGNPMDATYSKLKLWFKVNSLLRGLRDQTHYNEVDSNSAMFAKHYAKDVPSLPYIRLQRPDGVSIFEMGGPDVPVSPEAVSHSINTECFRRWRNRCPDGSCPSTPSPDQPNQPAPNPILDDPEPQPLNPPKNNLLAYSIVLFCGLAVALGLAVGGGAGLARGYRDAHGE